MSSKLYYKYATMSSGKSGVLLMNAHQMEERNIPFLCLKSVLDTRDGDNVIASRIGIKRECISVETTDNLFDFINEYSANAWANGLAKPIWIFIDECQFLTAKQVNELARVVDELDINVVCYGLRGDFLSKSFEGSRRLFELADEISEIKSSCSCGRKAIINARMTQDGNVVLDGEQIMIGGNDMYVPLCRKCFRQLIAKKHSK